LLAKALCQSPSTCLTWRFREQARRIESAAPGTGDRIQKHGHKLRANIGHRAGYCRELDSHKDFAA